MSKIIYLLYWSWFYISETQTRIRCKTWGQLSSITIVLRGPSCSESEIRLIDIPPKTVYNCILLQRWFSLLIQMRLICKIFPWQIVSYPILKINLAVLQDRYNLNWEHIIIVYKPGSLVNDMHVLTDPEVVWLYLYIISKNWLAKYKYNYFTSIFLWIIRLCSWT